MKNSKPMDCEPSTRDVTVKLPKELFDAIEKNAEEECRTIEQHILWIIKKFRNGSLSINDWNHWTLYAQTHPVPMNPCARCDKNTNAGTAGATQFNCGVSVE